MAILILHILLRQNSNLLLSYTYSSNEQQIIYISYIKKKDYISFRQTPVAEIAQLGERQTEDLKVPGSNPESLHEL